MRKLCYLLKRALFRMSPRAAEKLNIDFRLRAANRQFLEQSVFGYINRMAGQAPGTIKTLFVGVDKHNWHYPRLLKTEFHSLDIEAGKAVYGQPGRHWTGSATSVAGHYGDNAFDVVVANGLLGFGIDEAQGCRHLLENCEAVLKPGGLLVLGYNDRSDRVPYAVLPMALGLFDEFTPPIAEVAGALHRVDDSFQHVYLFLTKRRPAVQSDAAPPANARLPVAAGPAAGFR
jgi:SAM-dependent methyltransferase